MEFVGIEESLLPGTEKIHPEHLPVRDTTSSQKLSVHVTLHTRGMYLHGPTYVMSCILHIISRE